MTEITQADIDAVKAYYYKTGFIADQRYLEQAFARHRIRGASEMTNDMVEAILEQGRLQERQRVLERLRYGAKEFRRMAEDYPKWDLVAEILEEEADVIETGDY